MAITTTVRAAVPINNPGASSQVALTGIPAAGSALLIVVASVHVNEASGAATSSITGIPSVGTPVRLGAQIDNGAGNLPRIEAFWCPAVNVVSAPTLTINWSRDDWAGHYAVEVIELSGHSTNTPIFSAIAFSGAATTAFPSPSTGTLPSTGGLALQVAALRSNGGTYSVDSYGSGFSAIQNLLDTSDDSAAIIVAGSNGIGATTALSPTITMTDVAPFGAQTMTLYIEASGVTPTKTVRALAGLDCVGKTAVKVSVFETDATYVVGALLGEYTGKTFTSGVDEDGAPAAVLDIVDGDIGASIDDSVLVLALWDEDGVLHGIGPGLGVVQ